MILGHEILGVIDTPGETKFSPGQRVVIEPVLDCACRELPPCRFCAKGEYNLCENFLSGALPPGSFQGFNQAASGGMAERTAAHPSKILPVPDSLSDEDAVLVDSMASVAQPILENFPEPADTALVYGAGVLGQHAVRVLRALGFAGRLVVVARHGFQAELAKKGGADVVLRSPGRKELAKALDGTFVPTTMGGGNVEGGADIIYDCIASRSTVQESLLALRARGRYVMIGTAGTLKGVDFSSLWFRELQMTGSASYATAMWQGERVRTYQVCLDLLASGSYPTAGLLTGLFRLNDWKKAFQSAFDKSGTNSMKAAFDLR